MERINKSFFKFVSFYLYLFTITSCSDEMNKLISTSIADKDILLAREWYESNMTDSILLNLSPRKINNNNVNTSIISKPVWQNAFKTIDTTETAVVVPLKMQGNFGYISPEAEQLYLTTKDERYLQNETQMVIRTKKLRNQIDGFLMTLIPDAGYLKTSNFNAFSSSYRKWQKGYNGMVLYHTLDGYFANGWYISDGKVTKTIAIADPNSTIDARLNSNQGPSNAKEGGDCVDYTTTVWMRDCTDWYVNGIYQRTNCGAWYPEYKSDYIACPVDEYYIGWGAGGDYNPPVVNSIPSTAVKAITLNINLDNDGIDKLNEALQKLLEKCGYNVMYNFLTQNGKHFNNVYINPNKTGPAQYNSQTGDLVFQSNSDISTGLQEEFVHLFQNTIYTGGIAQYNNTGHSNIEFEAKLIEDLICFLNFGACGQYAFNDESINSNDYARWIYRLTDNGFPSYNDLLVRHSECSNKNYWDFLNAFAVDPTKPEYNYPVNSGLEPQGFNIINSNKCNN